jgi:translation elongation factor EF-1alpha
VPLDIDLGTLAPGQKISFEIKAKKTQIRNIKNKIDELQLQLRNAQRVKQLVDL